MKFFFILPFILLFCMSSCIIDGEDNEGSLGDREKMKKSIPRTPLAPKNTTQVTEPEEPQENTPQSPYQETPQETPQEVTQPDPDVEEDVIFPFSLSSEHTTIYISADEEHERITISAEPKERPIALIAGLSGEILIETNADVQIISIRSKHSKTLFFELDIENTNLAVSNGASITQQELIAESTEPIVFYVKENEQLTVTCLYINQLAGRIKVVKNFENPSICNE